MLTIVTCKLYKAIHRNMLKRFAYLRSKIFPKTYNVHNSVVRTIEASTKYKVDSKYFSVYTCFVGCFICINCSNINQNNKIRKLPNNFSVI